MKSYPKTWLSWALIGALALAGLSSCNKPKDRSEYSGSETKTIQVSIDLEKPAKPTLRRGNLRGKVSSLPPDTGTSLIIAVDASENFQANYLALTTVYDANLLNPTTGTVSLGLPLDTPLRLFEYTFSGTWPSAEDIKAVGPAAIAGADLGTLTLDGVTTSFVLNSSLTPLTPPASLSLVPGVTTLGTAGTTQIFAIASYPDGTSQDMTNLVNWSISNPAIATITNDINTSKGLVTGLTDGPVQVSAALLGVESTIGLTIGGGSLGPYFDQMMTNGSYSFETYDDGNGGLVYTILSTIWLPSHSETQWEISEANRVPTIPSTPQDRVVLSGGAWVPEAFNPTAPVVQEVANRLDFSTPSGHIRLVNARNIGGTVETMDLHGLSVSVPMAPGAVAYDLEYYLDHGTEQFKLEKLETTHDGTNTPFYSLDEFLASGSVDPFTCSESPTVNRCLMFVYNTGDTSGVLEEYELDQNFSVTGGPYAGGTWQIVNVDGVDILTVQYINPIFSQDGPPGDSIWSVYNGQVYYGWVEPAQVLGYFSEYNDIAADSFANHFANAPPEAFISPWADTGGGMGGGTPVVPQALNFNGSQEIRNGTASLLGLDNTWSIGLWFNQPTHANSTLLHIKQPGADESGIVVATDGAGGIVAQLFDSTAATNYVTQTTTAPFSTGEPHFLTLTWNGSVFDIYIDGTIFSATQTVTGTTPVQADIERIVRIGGDGLSTYHAGQIHSVMMWNSVLGMSEIQELAMTNQWAFKDDISFDMSMYVSGASLMHWWQFDDTSQGFGADYGNGTPVALDVATIGPADLTPFVWLDNTLNQTGGLTAPNGGENVFDGEFLNITWDTATISGASAQVFLMADPIDPTWLDPNATDIAERAAAVGWHDLSGGMTTNMGSFQWDPAGWGQSGSHYYVMVITESGNWDISDAPFSINDPNAPLELPQAAAFDGTQYMGSTTSAGVLAGSASFTVAGWFNPAPGPTVPQRVFEVSDGTTTNIITVTFDGGNNRLTITLEDGTVRSEYTTSGFVVRGQANFFAFTWDNAALPQPAPYLQLNGTQEVPGTTGVHTGLVNMVDSARQVYIGAVSSGVNQFTGDIMSMALWNSVLTPAELNDVYNYAGSFKQDLSQVFGMNYASSSSLMHWWQFDRDPALPGTDFGIAATKMPMDLNAFSTAPTMVPFYRVDSAGYVDGTITAPVGGEVFVGGTPQNITWDVANFTGNVTIFAARRAPNTPMGPGDPNLMEQVTAINWIGVGNVAASTGSFSFDHISFSSTFPYDTTYRFLLVDDAGNWDFVDGDVEFQ